MEKEDRPQDVGLGKLVRVSQRKRKALETAAEDDDIGIAKKKQKRMELEAVQFDIFVWNKNTEDVEDVEGVKRSMSQDLTLFWETTIHFPQLNRKNMSDLELKVVVNCPEEGRLADLSVLSAFEDSVFSGFQWFSRFAGKSRIKVVKKPLKEFCQKVSSSDVTYSVPLFQLDYEGKHVGVSHVKLVNNRPAVIDQSGEMDDDDDDDGGGNEEDDGGDEDECGDCGDECGDDDDYDDDDDDDDDDDGFDDYDENVIDSICREEFEKQYVAGLKMSEVSRTMCFLAKTLQTFNRKLKRLWLHFWLCPCDASIEPEDFTHKMVREFVSMLVQKHHDLVAEIRDLLEILKKKAGHLAEAVGKKMRGLVKGPQVIALGRRIRLPVTREILARRSEAAARLLIVKILAEIDLELLSPLTTELNVRDEMKIDLLDVLRMFLHGTTGLCTRTCEEMSQMNKVTFCEADKKYLEIPLQATKYLSLLLFCRSVQPEKKDGVPVIVWSLWDVFCETDRKKVGENENETSQTAVCLCRHEEVLPELMNEYYDERQKDIKTLWALDWNKYDEAYPGWAFQDNKAYPDSEEPPPRALNSRSGKARLMRAILVHAAAL